MLFITSRRDTRFDLTAAGARGLWRIGLQIVVAALGLAAIVGSGAGDDSWELPPQVTIEPGSVSVQVGASVTFTGHVSSSCRNVVSMQWCRRASWDAPCIELPGATGNTYTLSGANLSDDGATFTLTATCHDAKGLWNDGSARLAVSPMPGLVYLDGEFPEDQWLVTLMPAAAQAGSWGTASRMATGGNPGAYRAVSFNLPITLPQVLRVFQFQISQANAYDPATQGAINVLDFGTDCLGPAAGSDDLSVNPVIEQMGRMYVARNLPVDWYAMCRAPTWQRGPTASTLDRFAFWREDYPDYCHDGEACLPDFSAAGAPIRFGFVTSLSTSGAPAGASVTLGIDNWRVAVWRR